MAVKGASVVQPGAQEALAASKVAESSMAGQAKSPIKEKQPATIAEAAGEQSTSSITDYLRWRRLRTNF